MDQKRTISEIKQSFIRDQVRILSAPLEPAEGWRDYGPEIEKEIPDKTIDSVLQKLSSTIRQHNRTFYSTQAAHHVSQQIERLYLNAIDPELGGKSAPDSIIGREVDLTSSESIESLPEQWKSTESDADSQQRYKELRGRLASLNAERKSQQDRLAQYRQLKALLEPFSESQTNIQPNLVTKDGELAAELDQMRMLLAKVAGKIRQGGPDKDNTPTEAPLTQEDTNAKLAKLLDMT